MTAMDTHYSKWRNDYNNQSAHHFYISFYIKHDLDENCVLELGFQKIQFCQIFYIS